MNADPALIDAEPAFERVLFWLYQLATWLTFAMIDDAAMLAFAFSEVPI